MDTKKVKALLTVVKNGSLTAAAEELGYTQPGLTNMMNSFENELGLTLLIRSKSGVRLSPAGELLLDDAEDLMAVSCAFEKKVEQLRERSISSLRIGAYSSIARQWLPAIINCYKVSNPEARMSVIIYDIRDAYEAVRDGDLDCAIVSYQKSYMRGLAWIPLRNDELVALFPQENPPETEPVPVSAFRGLDFLMPSRGFDLDIMPFFEHSGKGLPNFRYTNMEDTAIISMVAHNLGVSIMSRLVMQGMREDIHIAPLKPASFRQLGIIVNEKQQNERYIKRFVATAQEALEKL